MQVFYCEVYTRKSYHLSTKEALAHILPHTLNINQILNRGYEIWREKSTIGRKSQRTDRPT